MEELSKLKSTLKRKPRRNSIPRAVSYWLFFKRHILERADVRAQFEEGVFDIDGFRQLVRTVANPSKWGPSFCRQRRGTSAKTAKRNTNDMLAVLWRYYEALLHPASPIYVAESEAVGGLGLFVRRAAAVVTGGNLFEGHLWGVPFEVAEDAFAELHAGDYPSLYRTPDGRAHILCGPLALVNHRCAAPLSFSLPKKIVAAPMTAAAASTVPATRLRKGGCISLEEFAGLSAVYARATMRHRMAKGQEVMVDYFGQEGRKKNGAISFGGVECKCLTCVAGDSND
jgi:hypothetical protein